jgi:hypothetical protein
MAGGYLRRSSGICVELEIQTQRAFTSAGDKGLFCALIAFPCVLPARVCCLKALQDQCDGDVRVSVRVSVVEALNHLRLPLCE